MSSTSILMVKRMEQRNRRMESIRDIEDDAGPVLSTLDLLELLLMVPSTVFGLLISPRSFVVTKLRYTITFSCGGVEIEREDKNYYPLKEM